MEDDREWEIVAIEDAQQSGKDFAVSNGTVYGLRIEFWKGLKHWNYSKASTDGRKLQPHSNRFQAYTSGREQRTVNAQDQSRLFTLPVEIRLYIYELVLYVPTTNSAVPLRITRSSFKSTQPVQSSVLSLLEACHQVLAEAEDIFYAVNRLLYVPQPSHAATVSFLSNVGERRLCAITSFTITSSSPSVSLEAIQQLRAIPRLLSLYIQMPVNLRYVDLTSWNLLAAQLAKGFEDLKCLREVKIQLPGMNEPNSEDKYQEQKLERVIERLRQATHPRDLAITTENI